MISSLSPDALDLAAEVVVDVPQDEAGQVHQEAGQEQLQVERGVVPRRGQTKGNTTTKQTIRH